ncbi:hypothetical protein T439DRAFT_326948 [Meredithblackwellia eburnea MCA 4105]
MADLKTYLASKYGSGAKAEAIVAHSTGEKRKKKKRKVDGSAGAGGGGMIIDDDDGGWGKKDEEDEDEFKPVVEQTRGQFKSKATTSSSWATVREADPSAYEPPRSPTPPPPDDEEPVVVDTTGGTSRGGLQSVAALRAENERRERELEKKKKAHAAELARLKKEREERGEEADEDDPHATVYRDASGKKIDMKLKRADEAKQKRDEMEREMKKMEWGKGLVQKDEVERRKREAEEEKGRPMARYADDKRLNDELKEQDRWNDPAAAFLTKDKKKKSSGYSFPAYQGPPPPPNRFGIKPGYRWDGVDRSNGFEAKFMQRGNAARVRGAEAHAWSTSDM